MRDEHLVDINPEATEDQGAGIGGGSALGIEVDLFAGQIRECFDLRSNEDVQFGREQTKDVVDALLDLRDLGLVLLQRVTVDDRRINPLQIKQIMTLSVGPRVTIGSTCMSPPSLTTRAISVAK